jgi:hypothetical protein
MGNVKSLFNKLLSTAPQKKVSIRARGTLDDMRDKTDTY